MENGILFNRKDRVRLKKYRDIICDGQLTDIGPEDIGEVVADCWGGYVKVDNPQYDRYSNVVAYENGIPSRIRCKRCGGEGYFVGNVKEAIDMLKASIANRKGLSVKESKQLLRILNNYNNGTQ